MGKIAFERDRAREKYEAPKFTLRERYKIKNCNPFFPSFIISSYDILLIIQPLSNNYTSDSRNRISNNTYFEAH